MTAIVIRPAGADDQAFLATLYRSTRADLLALAAPAAMIDLLITTQQQAQATGYRQAYPQAANLILLAGSVPAGRLLLDSTGDTERVVDLAVLPSERGRGHATAALRWVQASAHDSGRAVELSVAHDNAAARRLYLALGFRETGHDDVRVHLRWTGPDK